jgi:hypothetical protein
MANKKQKGGVIQTVLIVVGILVLLKYAYDLDVIDFLTQGKFKDLWDKFYEIGFKGWNEYKDILIKIWNFIWGTISRLIGK